MRHKGLPPHFTRIGIGRDGNEYIQCTRTGDVLVQTGPNDWSHFASADEWRSKTAAQLYPQLVHLRRALKQVGRFEEVEKQVQTLQEAHDLLAELNETVQERIRQLQAARVQTVATEASVG